MQVHTVGVGVAIGQSCMLLSAGTKGKRFMLPHATGKLAVISNTWQSSESIFLLWHSLKNSCGCPFTASAMSLLLLHEHAPYSCLTPRLRYCSALQQCFNSQECHPQGSGKLLKSRSSGAKCWPRNRPCSKFCRKPLAILQKNLIR